VIYLKKVKRYSNDGRILKRLDEKGRKTLYELRDELGMTMALVRKRCRKLLLAGLIKKEKKIHIDFTDGVSNRYFTITDKGKDVYEDYKQTIVILDD